MSQSGSKRPRPTDEPPLPYDGDAPPKKARDWRDAFLGDDEEPDRGEPSRRREDRRPRQDERGGRRYEGGTKDYRERDGSYRRGDRYPAPGRGGAGYGQQGRDGGRGAGGGGDRNGGRRENGGGRSYSRDARDAGKRVDDTEEGEITEPPKIIPAPGGKIINGTFVLTHSSRSPSLAHRSPAPAHSQPMPATLAKSPAPSSPKEEAKKEKEEKEGIPDLPLPMDEPEDIEALVEERRRKRRELMERLAGVQSGVGSAVSSVGGGSVQCATTPSLLAGAAHITLDSSANTPITTQPLPPTDFDLAKHAEPANSSTTEIVSAAEVLPAESQTGEEGEDQVNAADYDPNDDRKEDEARQARLHGDGVGEVVVKDEDVDMEEAQEEEWEEVEVEEEDDEEFDMFAVEEPKKKKIVRRRKENKTKLSAPAPAPTAPTLSHAALVDNFDDHEGYYRITPGEVLDNGRYQVSVNLGKGMFSAVIRAKVLVARGEGEEVGREVAIKVIRSQESMYVAGRKEAQILAKLAAADPDDKKHIVRLIRTFEHRGHLCLVTESLSMNLRDVVKRFGKDVGLNMRAVRAYAHQMFLAMSLMKKVGIIHADIKPDNILVTENKAVLKVCDLGSACEATESEITPYLVSRFYRAPEIILGLPYNEALDMWSIGCTLYELYTGKILFPGRSNNQMLHLMMDLKGKFNHRMIKKSQFGEMHFDEGMNFRSVERDKISGLDVTKTLIISKASKDLKTRLIPSSAVQNKMKTEDLNLLVLFVDLIDKCLTLDPAKRLSAREALGHGFLTAP